MVPLRISSLTHSPFPPRNLPIKFGINPSTIVLVIVVTDRHTDRQTRKPTPVKTYSLAFAGRKSKLLLLLRTEEGDCLQQVTRGSDLVSMMWLDTRRSTACPTVTHRQVTFRRATTRWRHLLLHRRHKRVQNDRQREVDVGRSHWRIFYASKLHVNNSQEFQHFPWVARDSHGNGNDHSGMRIKKERECYCPWNIPFNTLRCCYN